jgi:hypothetical protein
MTQNDKEVILHAVNDCFDGKQLSYKVTLLNDNSIVCKGDFVVGENCEQTILKLNKFEKGFYLIEWECEGQHYFNHYVADLAGYDIDEYIKYMQLANINKGVTAFE